MSASGCPRLCSLLPVRWWAWGERRGRQAGCSLVLWSHPWMRRWGLEDETRAGVCGALTRVRCRVQELEEKQLEFVALWQRPFGGSCADRIRAIEPSNLAAELRLT